MVGGRCDRHLGMARPVRVNVEGGWYHVTARGIERRAIFDGARDQEHLLDLLAAMRERYVVEIHAYCLMGNHYHALIRTPGANASEALQWLNVSYSVWFNRRRRRVGHVFQGRFGSVLIDGQGDWALGASVYIHLNPIRTLAAGLGKTLDRAEALGLSQVDPETAKWRMRELRLYRWSSYRAYAGYGSAPEWLTTGVLLQQTGGPSGYRELVRQHAVRGTLPSGYEDLRGRVALGSQAFLKKVRGWAGRVTREQPGRRDVMRWARTEDIVRVVEAEWGEPWAQFCDRHGDWGRDLALYLARQRSGLSLRQIAEAFGVGQYKAVGKAVERFSASLDRSPVRRRTVAACLRELSNVET